MVRRTIHSGKSLQELIDEQGILSEDDIRYIGRELCLALGQLHGAGLVHRDCKPSNIVMSPTGPVLIDLGIAWAPELTKITSNDNAFASLGYASPEHLAGKIVTTASDVYSLGAVLAFAATSTLHLMEVAIDNSRLTSELKASIRRCLDMDPSARPNLDQMAEELGGRKCPSTIPYTLMQETTSAFESYLELTPIDRILKIQREFPVDHPTGNYDKFPIDQQLRLTTEDNLRRRQQQKAREHAFKELNSVLVAQANRERIKNVREVLAASHRLWRLLMEHEVPPNRTLLWKVKKWWGMSSFQIPAWVIDEPSQNSHLFLSGDGELWYSPYGQWSTSIQREIKFNDEEPGENEDKCIEILRKELPSLIEKYNLPW